MPVAGSTGAMPVAIAPTPEDYRLGPLDRISMSVFQVPSLSVQKIQIDASGHVNLPLIGRVKAGGKTTAELSQEVATLLGKEYLESPQVTISLEEAYSQTITVDGSVVQPGVYPIVGQVTLMQAVALARGPDNRYANLKRVAVFRTTEGQRTVAVFDLQAIRKGQAADPVILPQDIIVVDGSDLKGAWREVMSILPSLAVFRFF
ncbi:MAG: polysaccharide biosynthesis/export family protein [Caulobacter sp.]